MNLKDDSDDRVRGGHPFLWMTLVAVVLYFLTYPAFRVLAYARLIDVNAGVGEFVTYFFAPPTILEQNVPIVNAIFDWLVNLYYMPVVGIFAWLFGASS